MKKIILASTSPRRSEILEKLQIPFSTIAPPFEEHIPANMTIDTVPEYFAQEKALSVLPLVQDNDKINLILGVDTIVVCDGIAYGKPNSIEEAKETLRCLSGKEHTILSGIAMYNRENKKMISKTSKNTVIVKELSENDINWYLSKNEWIDAAGSYKIQGLFQRYISELKGSFSSVMGLPIFEFYDILEKHEYTIV